MAKKTTRLLMMRSGSTDWDRAGRVQGATDLPLADAGRAEVDQLARNLEGTKLSVVFTGPDEASRETARIVARATRARVEVLSDLSDLRLGLWEGLLCNELEQRCRAGKMFLDDGAGVVPPGGEESLEVFAARLLPALDAAIGRRRGAVGVVLRPISLGVVRCSVERAGLESFWEMVRSFAGPSWYELSAEPGRLPMPGLTTATNRGGPFAA